MPMLGVVIPKFVFEASQVCIPKYARSENPARAKTVTAQLKNRRKMYSDQTSFQSGYPSALPDPA